MHHSFRRYRHCCRIGRTRLVGRTEPWAPQSGCRCRPLAAAGSAGSGSNCRERTSRESAGETNGYRLAGGQATEVPTADAAALESVTVRPRPMGLQTEIALVAVGQQSTHLPLPIDVPRSKRPPDRLVADDLAVFGMNVTDATPREQFVPAWERSFPRD